MANAFWHVTTAILTNFGTTLRGTFVALVNPLTGEPIGTSGYPLYVSGVTATADVTLWTARTADGSPAAVDWGGGPGLLSVFGTWGTATVQLSYSPDAGTTYIDVEGGMISAGANTMLAFSLPAGKVKATIATASGPTSLTAIMQSTR